MSSSRFWRELTKDMSAWQSDAWAVVLGDDEKLVLQLQGLPVTVALLNGKPSFKR